MTFEETTKVDNPPGLLSPLSAPPEVSCHFKSQRETAGLITYTQSVSKLSNHQVHQALSPHETLLLSLHSSPDQHGSAHRSSAQRSAAQLGSTQLDSAHLVIISPQQVHWLLLCPPPLLASLQPALANCTHQLHHPDDSSSSSDMLAPRAAWHSSITQEVLQPWQCARLFSMMGSLWVQVKSWLKLQRKAQKTCNADT